jgi:hypothetical protein
MIIGDLSRLWLPCKSSVFDRMILASKNRVRTCKIWGGEKQIDVLMQGMGGTIKVKYDILAYHWTAILHIPNLLGRMTVIRYDQRGPPSPALVHQSVSPPPIFYTFLLCFCLLRSFCQRQTTYLLLGFSILIILYIHSFSHLHNVHSFAHLYIEPSRSRLYGS